jgi:hypothetical protein
MESTVYTKLQVQTQTGMSYTCQHIDAAIDDNRLKPP